MQTFIDGLPASIQSTVRKIVSREKGLHFLENAQCANTLLERTRQKSNFVVDRVDKIYYDRGRRMTYMMTVVAEVQTIVSRKH